MTHVRTIMVAALYVSMVGSPNEVEAQAPDRSILKPPSSMRPIQRKPIAEIPKLRTAWVKRLNRAVWRV